MDYFQYKAQQMLLLKKEDHEWQDFCKQVAPECAACSAEETNITESNDIGVQATSKKSINEIRKVTFESKQTDKQIPEALKNITSTLQKIDFALSKIHDVPSEDEKLKSKAVSLPDSERSFRTFEEQRKLLIQNSLRASLKKLQSTSSVVSKKPPATIKIKNSGYFIPHELQVKRIAARKAYLASLETKPKISFQNCKKNVPVNQNKKIFPKKNLKSKKNVTKPANQESDVCKDEVQTAVSETNEIKDENIEKVVNGILDDLLKDAALDFNRIKEKKKSADVLNNDRSIGKGKEIFTPSISSAAMQTEPKLAANDNCDIKDLKLFFDSSKKLKWKSEDLKKDLVCDNTYAFSKENEKTMKKTNNDSVQCETSSGIKIQPKFICEASHVLTIDKQSAKNISRNKDNFFKYLEKISRRVKENFNPWVLNEMLAESILDECIEDVAKELSEFSDIAVENIYNKEFVQVIE